MACDGRERGDAAGSTGIDFAPTSSRSSSSTRRSTLSTSQKGVESGNRRGPPPAATLLAEGNDRGSGAPMNQAVECEERDQAAGGYSSGASPGWHCLHRWRRRPPSICPTRRRTGWSCASKFRPGTPRPVPGEAARRHLHPNLAGSRPADARLLRRAERNVRLHARATGALRPAPGVMSMPLAPCGL